MLTRVTHLRLVDADTELTLEPNANPAAKAFQDALFEQGIPLTAFEVDDLEAECERLRSRGVEFTKVRRGSAPS